MLAKNIMIPNPYTINPTVTMNEANYRLNQLGIGHFAVIDPVSNHFLGIVSDTDLLPYAPPDDFPSSLTNIKLIESHKIKIFDVMTPIENIGALIYEDEDSDSFIQKFYRSGLPCYNLLFVANNEKEKKLLGVISWVEILKNWSALVSESSLEFINTNPAVEYAVPLDEIPSVGEGQYSAGSALARSKNTIHRHIQIRQKDKIISLFHFHELLPYRPIGDNIILEDYWHNELKLDKLKPKYSIEERTIPFDLPIWLDEDDNDENCVIRKFGKYIIGNDETGKPKKWQNRMAGLLLQQSDKKQTISHLLNPYDIIATLIKKKLECKVLLVISVEQDNFVLLVPKQNYWYLPTLMIDSIDSVESKLDLNLGDTSIVISITQLIYNDDLTNIIAIADILPSSLGTSIDEETLFSFTQARKKLKLPKDRNSLNQAVERWFQTHRD